MQKAREAFRTIGEVASWLGVPPHVLRFWESKFTQVRPVKRAGGRRYYRRGDMALLGGIKVLLHDRGMTIKGVQRILSEDGAPAVVRLAPDLDDLGEPQDALALLDDVEVEDDGAEALEADPPGAPGASDGAAPRDHANGGAPDEDREAPAGAPAAPAEGNGGPSSAPPAPDRPAMAGPAPRPPSQSPFEQPACEREAERGAVGPDGRAGARSDGADPAARPDGEAASAQAPAEGGASIGDAASPRFDRPPLAHPPLARRSADGPPVDGPPRDGARDGGPPMPVLAPARAEGQPGEARASAGPPPEDAGAPARRERVVRFAPPAALAPTGLDGGPMGRQPVDDEPFAPGFARAIEAVAERPPTAPGSPEETMSPMRAPDETEPDDHAPEDAKEDAPEDAQPHGGAAAWAAEASEDGPGADDAPPEEPGEPPERAADREAPPPAPPAGGEASPDAQEGGPPDAERGGRNGAERGGQDGAERGGQDGGEPAAERRRQRVAAVPDCAEAEGVLVRRPTARPSNVRLNNDAILALVRRLEAVRDRMDP